MKNILSIWGINWIHISQPSKSEVQDLSERYDLHEIIEEDIFELNTQDKVDVYDDYVFMVFHFPKYNEQEKRYMLNEFDIILWKNFIISITRFHTNHIQKIMDEYSKEIKEDQQEQDLEAYKISPYYVLYKIVDVMFDKALNILNKISRDTVYMEEQVFSKDKLNKNLLESLMIRRRNIAFLKHTFLPQWELLQELQKVIWKFYNWQIDLYFEDIVYKLDRIENQISILSENLNSLADTYNTLMNIRINGIINVLTIFTALIWTLTLISWIYGMNINLPFQESPYAFLFVAWSMIVSVSIMIWIFKKKGWI